MEFLVCVEKAIYQQALARPLPAQLLQMLCDPTIYPERLGVRIPFRGGALFQQLNQMIGTPLAPVLSKAPPIFAGNTFVNYVRA